MALWLIPAFALTALLYASAGFGGGSTYTALLALAGTDYRILPSVSLLCNIVVVAGGTWRHARAGTLPFRRVLPLVALSVPLAWMGGLTPISERAFLWTLAVSLGIAGTLLLLRKASQGSLATARRKTSPFDLAAGAGCGYLAGLVGIGGGIFLAPLLHLTRWGPAREIAATASLFILVNSVAGLIGQAMKLSASGGAGLAGLPSYWPLIAAVLLGGQIGSWLGIKRLAPLLLARITGALILFVAGQLAWRLAGF